MAKNAIAHEMLQIIWGTSFSEDVFQRWCQGLEFSETEKTALVQRKGGPCSIIAPLQAFLLKNLIFTLKISDWRGASLEQIDEALIVSITEIFNIVRSPDRPFYLVTLPNDSTHRIHTSSEFHSNIHATAANSQKELVAFTKKIRSKYGYLLFLYSLMLTKGIDSIKTEVADGETLLIDPTHGHGSQALINLMLVGTAVPHVFDGSQMFGGLLLKGIVRQPQIGFLTILEEMRYCEVGSFYKNPVTPVWVLGSETHYTVAFSTDLNVVTAETERQTASRVFKQYDTDSNGFISVTCLTDVLRDCSLVSEPPEYVQIVEEKLDPDGTGVILLELFLNEYFGLDPFAISSFVIYHYNGLSMNRTADKFYRIGHAKTMDALSPDECLLSADTKALLCLQTKWPGLDVEWESGTPLIS